ncbi:restriction endonuclease subunit S [Enterocloster clostridioformis]|uniref:restriction endonuclease subunit S n=1 Tax=Enterocloster clostridioformis TaxID=1531 RepID=UPI002676B51A|nr:restriction endonuclease subunit S [Enterocloster clostridioformis]
MRKYVALGDVCKKGSSNIAQKDIENSNGTYAIYGANGYIKDVNFYHQDKPYIAVVKDGAGIGRTMLLPEKTSVIGTLQYLIPNDSISVKYLYYEPGQRFPIFTLRTTRRNYCLCHQWKNSWK